MMMTQITYILFFASCSGYYKLFIFFASENGGGGSCNKSRRMQKVTLKLNKRILDVCIKPDKRRIVVSSVENV